MTESDKQILDIESAVQRTKVPDTMNLQNTILQATATMPQSASLTQKQSRWQSVKSMFRVKPYLMTGGSLMAFCAVLTLSVLLFVPNNPATVVEVADNNEHLLSDELVWQDLMLIHDELAFNDL